MITNAYTAQANAAGDNRVRFVASTKTVDRHGTRLLPTGCRHENFQRNPVFLWNHNKDGGPDDVIGTVVELSVTEDAVVALVEFDSGEKAQKCLRRVRRGVLRAVSVGFIPLRDLPPDAEGIVDVLEWELCELSLCPVGSNPDALAIRSFTLACRKNARPISRPRTSSNRTGQETASATASRGRMDPKVIFEKLGIAEGAKPEDIAAALIKYLTGPDSDADKLSLVIGLLGMLTPAPSNASDGAEAAARDAMADEVRKLEARVAELEGEKEKAMKRAEPTPEELAERAIKGGQWPMGQRAALVEQYKSGKTPFLFKEKTFSSRGVSFTSGGNPAAAIHDKSPSFGDEKTKPNLNEVDNLVISIAKRAGLNLTPESYAAARKARSN